MSICGLDFGTSNTTLGTVMSDVPVLAALEGDHVTIPSAIFYKADSGAFIGRQAIEAYVEGDAGRPDAQPQIGARHVADRRDHAGGARARQLPRRHRLLHRRGEAACGAGHRARVAAGRAWPSRAFRRRQSGRRCQGRSTLCATSPRRSASTDVTFQFEPIAAALDYERQISFGRDRADRRHRRRHVGFLHRPAVARAPSPRRAQGRYSRQ